MGERARQVLHATPFYPRGGSSNVIRSLCEVIPKVSSWEALVVAGSLGPAGTLGNGDSFYGGLRRHVVPYDSAVAAYESGEDPLAAERPLHPSFEARNGIPDRVLAQVSPAVADHQLRFWEHELRPLVDEVDLLHLHHLTPLHGAAAALPVPSVTHLHGTELNFLERAEELGPYGAYWRKWLRAWAHRSDVVLVLSTADHARATRLLSLPESAVVIQPNGVDTAFYRPERWGNSQRAALWQSWLVDHPKGWGPSPQHNTLRYDPERVARWFSPDRPGGTPAVLLAVTRFLAFKRLPVLLEAYRRALGSFTTRAPLVVLGGVPGECEGRHPQELAEELGLDSVFFVGWRRVDELRQAYQASDVVVSASDEPFGLAFLEGMATGIPVVATRAGGPATFIDPDGATANGWLADLDSAESASEMLRLAVNSGAERERRGRNAVRMIADRYSWQTVGTALTSVYDEVARLGRRGSRPASATPATPSPRTVNERLGSCRESSSPEPPASSVATSSTIP